MDFNRSVAKSHHIFSIRRLGLAGLTGAAACAACCSVPLLAAAGVGGGALTTLAAHMLPGAEFVVGLGAAGIVLGLAALRRRRAAACADACSVPVSGRGMRVEAGSSAAGACGCGSSERDPITVYRSPEPPADEAIVCTADLTDGPTVQGQIDGYRAAFAHLMTTERFPGGFRWVFRKAPGFDAQLKRLAEAEHQCCRFFSFDITTTSEHVVWETRAHASAWSVLEFFAALPERLKEEGRPGADVAWLKQRSSAAGLRFAADEE